MAGVVRVGQPMALQASIDSYRHDPNPEAECSDLDLQGLPLGACFCHPGLLCKRFYGSNAQMHEPVGCISHANSTWIFPGCLTTFYIGQCSRKMKYGLQTNMHVCAHACCTHTHIHTYTASGRILKPALLKNKLEMILPMAFIISMVTWFGTPAGHILCAFPFREPGGLAEVTPRKWPKANVCLFVQVTCHPVGLGLRYHLPNFILCEETSRGCSNLICQGLTTTMSACHRMLWSQLPNNGP